MSSFRRCLLMSVAVAAISAPAAAQTITLDTITVLVEKVRQRAIDALAGVSTFGETELADYRPARISEILRTLPNVWVRENNANPAQAISIRGMQDYGRVAVIVDGARQNFQTSGHNANGVFFVDPSMLAGGEIVRGPVSNIYGSGAIGGVASFRTKDTDDVLAEGNKVGFEMTGVYRPNGELTNGSLFLAARPADWFDFVVGTAATHSDNYKDGNGNVVSYTGNSTESLLGKLTLRPAEGHELKLGATHYLVDYADATYLESSVETTNYTAKYTFDSPDNPLIDLSASAYLTQTEMDQFRPSPARTRYFDIQTTGFDINNTSRFDAWGLAHAVTYGGDFFQDQVETGDTGGSGNLFTPSGERSVGGAFVQWKAKYEEWLEVVSAARYDTYELHGGLADTELEGSRISPKLTVGVTPLDGLTLYGTYAEGYRAPALSETLISGQHPAFGPSTPGFDFLPNPDLKPEIGHTLEAGINAEYNDVLTDGDQFRAKFNVFRNNVTDYIGAKSLANGQGDCDTGNPSGCYQYVNIDAVELHGVEAEARYDAGRWFAGVTAGQTIGSTALSSDLVDLVPPPQVTVDAGMRFFDEMLTASLRWQHVWGKQASASLYYPAYDLLGLTVSYQPTEEVTASLIVDNLLDAYYVPYLGTTSKPSPGISVKGALTLKFGVN